MGTVSRILLFVASCFGIILVLWLGIAFLADEQSYIKLVRAGLLLIGLGGIAWGFLWRRPWVPLMGLAFLAVGFLACFIGPNSWNVSPPIGGQWTVDLTNRLAQPLGRSGNLKIWHLVGVVFLVLNVILFVNRVDWRRFVAANLLVIAGSLLIVFTLVRD